MKVIPAQAGIQRNFMTASDEFSPRTIEQLAESIGRAGVGAVIAAYVNWARDMQRQGTAEPLADLAHALRSSSRVLGLSALADCCEEIDVAVREGARIDLDAQRARLDALLANALAFLAAQQARYAVG